MHRLYWSTDWPPPTPDGVAAPEPVAAHLSALRLSPGERIECFSGPERRFCCRAEKTRRGWAVKVVPGELDPPPVPPRCRLSVWLPAIDAARFDWAVEKLTELGVAEIGLLQTERSQHRGRPAGRIERVAIRAAEQSGRVDLPLIAEPRPLLEIAAPPVLVLDRPGATVALAAGARPAGAVSLVVGPEGGWTGSERKLVAERGARFYHLVPTTLRTETAAVTGAGVVLAG